MSKRSSRRKRKRNNKPLKIAVNKVEVSKRNYQNIQNVGFYNEPKVTKEGFLVVDVVIASVGPLAYEYEMPDGEIVVRYELLSADAIFDPVFVESCDGAPFVLQHPQNNEGDFVDVSPENFDEVMKGVLIKPRKDKNKGLLIGTLKIFDKEVIQLVETKELAEVSQGYTCKILDRSGTMGGQPYEVEQVELIMNHLALVDEGRSGEAVRVLFNSKKSTIKIQEFVKRKTFEMKKTIAHKKQNAATLASKEADEAKRDLEATQAALKVNMAEGADKGDDGDKTENPASIDEGAKETSAMVNEGGAPIEKENMDEPAPAEKENEAGDLMQQVAQALTKVVEMIQGASQPSESEVVNEGDEMPPEEKESVLNSSQMKRIINSNIIEMNNTYSKGASILGAEQSLQASTKFNTTDEFRRFCLLTTKFKTVDQVSKMNHNQVEAHFDVLADQTKAAINAPDHSKINSSIAGANEDEKVSFSEFNKN